MRAIPAAPVPNGGSYSGWPEPATPATPATTAAPAPPALPPPPAPPTAPAPPADNPPGGSSSSSTPPPCGSPEQNQNLGLASGLLGDAVKCNPVLTNTLQGANIEVLNGINLRREAAASDISA